jgi:hypothetical protein
VASYTINLNAVHVPNDRRIWRMFPGKEYRFFETFLKDGVVFLELPGLDLPEGEISSNTPLLREGLTRSARVRAWIELSKKYERSAKTGEPPTRPDRNLQTYMDSPRPRGYTNELGSILTLFGTAKKGDLVVIPDRISERHVVVGEFVDEPGRRISQESRVLFLDEKTPLRRVSWFPKTDELRVPIELSGVLRIPVPISLVPNSLNRSIFENSYGTFYRDDEYSARLNILGDNFDAQSNLDLASLAKFAAVVCSVPAGEPDALRDRLVDYLSVSVGSEFLPAISLNVNSPGFGNLKSGAIVPIFFAAFFALLGVALAEDKPKPEEVSVVNATSGSEDHCVAHVAESVRETLRSVSYDQWKRLCEQRQRLQVGPKINVDPHVSPVK